MFLNAVLTKTQGGLDRRLDRALLAAASQFNSGGRMGHALRARPHPERARHLHRLAIHRHDLAAAQPAGMDALRSRRALRASSNPRRRPASRWSPASTSRTSSTPTTGQAAIRAATLMPRRAAHLPPVADRGLLKSPIAARHGADVPRLDELARTPGRASFWAACCSRSSGRARSRCSIARSIAG